MEPKAAARALVVHNAGTCLPDIEPLIARAREASAATIVCLNFASESRPAPEVAAWTERSSHRLAVAQVHLLTFNTDLALATRRLVDLSPGLHRIAPRIWLVVRLWIPGCVTGRASVGFVGPGMAEQHRFAGSLWADELLKPADLELQRSCHTVITDVNADQIATRSIKRPHERHALALHTSLGPAVVQRLTPTSVWAPGSRSISMQQRFARVQPVPPGVTTVATPPTTSTPIS